MRVMVLVKANEDSENGVMPDLELIDAMGKFNEELVKAGVMLDGDGLKPSSAGKRIVFDGSTKRTVVDGPFAETKELVAGYWVWQVKDMDEALEWARRCPNPTGKNGVLELRPFFEAEDWADHLPAEVLEKEAALRAETAAQKNA